MSKFRWKLYFGEYRRVVMIADREYAGIEWIEATEAAKWWCRKNNIFHWCDTCETIRFTRDKDVTAFLLRWG